MAVMLLSFEVDLNDTFGFLLMLYNAVSVAWLFLVL